MAKLTPEEKALNKLATQLRDHAFRERYKQYRAKFDAAEQLPAVRKALETAEGFRKEQDLQIENRNAATALIDQQICLLQQQRKELIDSYEPAFCNLSVNIKMAYDAWRTSLADAQAVVQNEYPDMVGVYSSGQWRSFTEYVSKARVAIKNAVK